jgi:hypothetical protein
MVAWMAGAYVLCIGLFFFSWGGNIVVTHMLAFQNFQIWLAAIISDSLLYLMAELFRLPLGDLTLYGIMQQEEFNWKSRIWLAAILNSDIIWLTAYNTARSFDSPLFNKTVSHDTPLHILHSGESIKNREYLREFKAKIKTILSGLSGPQVELFYRKTDMKNFVILSL